MKVLLLGGTRFVGRRLAELLVAAGASVTVLTRGETGNAPKGTEALIGDRSLPTGLDALNERHFDAVVDFSAYQASWVRSAIEQLRGRISHYVFISSGVVYEQSPSLPWAETAPLGPLPVWGTYGIEKLQAETIIKEHGVRGDISESRVRLPFVLGSANYADREAFVFSRLEAGRPIIVPGGGRAIVQFVHREDVARGLLAILSAPQRASGNAFNLGYSQGLTNRGFVELLAKTGGYEPDIVSHSLPPDGEVVDLANLVFPFPEQHFLLDTRFLREHIGFEAQTTHEQMAEEFWDWWSNDKNRSACRVYPRELDALEQLRLPSS